MEKISANQYNSREVAIATGISWFPAGLRTEEARVAYGGSQGLFRCNHIRPWNQKTSLRVKEKFPGRIQVDPARRIRPACRYCWNVKQRMTFLTHQFCAVPGKKRPRGDANPRRMCHAAQADRAALSLIVRYPPKAQKTKNKGEEKLRAWRSRIVYFRVCVNQVDWKDKKNTKKQRKFSGEERPRNSQPRARQLGC